MYKMVNYQDGKIYKIVCNITGKTYYGSTTKKRLNDRLSAHVYDFKMFKKSDKIGHYISSFEVLISGDYNIVLVENCPCDSRDELHKRERFYIESNECVNLTVPTKSQQEYYQERKEFFENYHKQYRLNNVEMIKERQLQYRLNNLEKIHEKDQIYAANHKQEKQEYDKIYRATNADKKKSNDKIYAENNKEKLKEYRKQRRLLNPELTKERDRQKYLAKKNKK
jgi:hypothetical protein